MPDDTLSDIAAQLALALRPLREATASPAALRDFLEELGWDFAAAPGALDALAAPAAQGENVGNDAGASAGAVLAAVKAAFDAISNLGSAASLANDFRGEFPRQLVDYLVVDYLMSQQPTIGHLLHVLGLVRIEWRAAAAGRPAHLHRSVAYEDLGKLVNDPLALFRGAYRWGQSDFDGERLIFAMRGLLQALGLQAHQALLDDATLAQLNQGALVPGSAEASHLRLTLFEADGDVEFAAGVGLFLLPETAAAKPGFALLPFASARLEEAIRLSEYLSVALRGELDLEGGLGLLVRPARDIEFLTGFGAGTPSAIHGNFGLGFELSREGGTPIILIGNAAASNLQVGGVSTLAGTRFHSGGRFEVFTELALQAGKIVVKAGPNEQDGFLARLLPPEGFQVPFDFTVGFSTKQGLYFGGSGGLEIALPAHVQLGPIEIVSALLAVKFKPAANPGGPFAIPVDIAATIKGDLAVLKATVENIGLAANFTFPPDRKGNLGPVNLALGFRPPNGVGLVVDAGVVKGGGYLFFDFDKGEYAGALELTFSGFLSLKAIGLINTKLPGGQSGFSLLIIITAEFMPGFQLGFGFVLAGVGGLLGLNRAMLLDPLAQGVRTGAVNNILFPTNVVENAPRILSDLRAIFPPFEGKFLIGPMAKLGWGTPVLISVSLGIVIEIPGNVVILGRLRLNLPTEASPLVLLQVTFIGAIEFDKRRIWFFASLFESRVLFITLDGEMGLLMDFSDNPNFVLSVGGFHPRYKAPALPFPSPRRISLSIIDESFARVRVDGYFAVTSNSVQFGSRTEMFFGFDALSVEGHLGFDALLQFSPLYFIVEVSCGFGVKVFGVGVFGVHLRGSLEGPAPWRVRGSAEISLLFFSIDVDVDVTFGERNSDTLPPIAVMPLLLAEFDKPANWVASLPPSGQLLVSLRKLGEADGLVLHPVGVLRVSQRALPLNLEFQKVGNQKNSDVNRLSIEVEAVGLQVSATARESFARAQYQEMDDAAKLSQPPFEKLEGGVDIAPGGASWAVGPGAQRNVRYEAIIVDTLFERFLLRLFPFFAGLFEHFRAGSAIKRSGLSQAQERKRRPFADKVDLPGDRYVVASSADNRAMSGEASVFASFAEAQMHMDDALRADPGLADSIHVIAVAEMQA